MPLPTLSLLLRKTFFPFFVFPFFSFLFFIFFQKKFLEKWAKKMSWTTWLLWVWWKSQQVCCLTLLQETDGETLLQDADGDTLIRNRCRNQKKPRKEGCRGHAWVGDSGSNQVDSRLSTKRSRETCVTFQAICQLSNGIVWFRIYPVLCTYVIS